MPVIPFGLFLDQLRSARHQHRINSTCQPVAATVLAAHVTSFTGSKGAIHYVPKVQYLYEVEGKTCHSEALMSLPVRGDEAWA